MLAAILSQDMRVGETSQRPVSNSGHTMFVLLTKHKSETARSEYKVVFRVKLADAHVSERDTLQ